VCEKLIEFHSDDLADLRDAVAREHNFRVTSHRFTIMGICRECSRTRHRRQSPMDLV
jgi:Fur family ferric uptake transcriptional regulator